MLYLYGNFNVQGDVHAGEQCGTPCRGNGAGHVFEPIHGQSLFMRCSAWRDLAGHCAQSLSKGMRVVATGRLSQRSYQAQDGTNRTVVEMTVDEIGPSLRYATAQVTKQGGHDGYQGGSTFGNPNGQSPQQQQPQQTTPPPASDPWANGGSGYTPDTFTTDTGDPEF